MRRGSSWIEVASVLLVTLVAAGCDGGGGEVESSSPEGGANQEALVRGLLSSQRDLYAQLLPLVRSSLDTDGISSAELTRLESLFGAWQSDSTVQMAEATANADLLWSGIRSLVDGPTGYPPKVWGPEISTLMAALRTMRATQDFATDALGSQDDLFERVTLTPEGGEFELEDGWLLLQVPEGAVESEFTVGVATLRAAMEGRSEFFQRAAGRYWTGREIGGQVFEGRMERTLLGGVEFDAPDGASLLKPLRVSIPSIAFEPTRLLPVQSRSFVWEGFGHLELTSVDVSAVERVEGPNALDLMLRWITYEVPDFGQQAIYHLETTESAARAAALNECEDPATSCRCGRIYVESSFEDFGGPSCTIVRDEVRVTFLDCPGQPVETHSVSEVTPDCQTDDAVPERDQFLANPNWQIELSKRYVIPERYPYHPLTRETSRMSGRGMATLLPVFDDRGEQQMEFTSWTQRIAYWETDDSESCQGSEGDAFSLPASPLEAKVAWFPDIGPHIYVSASSPRHRFRYSTRCRDGSGWENVDTHVVGNQLTTFGMPLPTSGYQHASENDNWFVDWDNYVVTHDLWIEPFLEPYRRISGTLSVVPASGNLPRP